MGAIISRKFLAAVFSYCEMLGIDKCLGAIGSGAFAASLLKAKIRMIWWFLLPAAVWIAHIVDGLLATRKSGREARGIRHEFYRKHYRLLVMLASLTVAVCSIIFLYLPDMALTGGFFLCLPVTLRLAQTFWNKILIGKEISIAIIYSLGVWFGPFLRRGCAVSWIHITGFLLFTFAAAMNRLTKSLGEYQVAIKPALGFSRSGFPMNRARVTLFVSSWLVSLGILIVLKYGIKHRFEFIAMAGFCFLLILCAAPGVMISEESFNGKNPQYGRQPEWLFSLGTLLIFIPP